MFCEICGSNEYIVLCEDDDGIVTLLCEDCLKKIEEDCEEQF